MQAQSLPRNLLLPTLRMIDILAARYGCSVVLCTATQPAFDSRQLKQGGLPLEGRELAPDPVGLASRLRRARIVKGGALEDAALIAALRDAQAQGVRVVVSSRCAWGRVVPHPGLAFDHSSGLSPVKARLALALDLLGA